MAEYVTKHGDAVRLRILEMGLTLWRVDPTYVTARRIASELGLTHPTILYHFKTSAALTNAIAFHAVKQGEARVIVHLIAMKHPAVATMPDVERQAYVRGLSGTR